MKLKNKVIVFSFLVVFMLFLSVEYFDFKISNAQNISENTNSNNGTASFDILSNVSDLSNKALMYDKIKENDKSPTIDPLNTDVTSNISLIIKPKIPEIGNQESSTLDMIPQKNSSTEMTIRPINITTNAMNNGSNIGQNTFENLTTPQKIININNTEIKNPTNQSISTLENNSLLQDIQNTWKNFTSVNGYSLLYPSEWNLTVNDNETHIESDKLNSEYLPIISISVRYMDPSYLNNSLSTLFPFEQNPSLIVPALLNNTSVLSNIQLKYYIDLDYDVLEPTKVGNYILDGKPASSFKVHKSGDNYEIEHITVINKDKIYNFDINYDYFLSSQEDNQIQKLKDRIINSIKWTNVTKSASTEEDKKVETEKNDDNEIKKTLSSASPDIRISSTTDFLVRDTFHIVGEVSNQGQASKELVKIVVTLYDTNGNVIGTKISYTDPSTIQPGESAPFEILISEGDVSSLNAIKSYKLYVTSEITSSNSQTDDLKPINNISNILKNLTIPNTTTPLNNFTINQSSTINNQKQESNPGDIIEVSILPGASTLYDKSYSPNPIEVKVGQKVKWENDDTAFHTVTSGSAGSPDSGKMFDSGLSGPNALTTKGKEFEHVFNMTGEFNYFCMLHPFMTGKVIVK